MAAYFNMHGTIDEHIERISISNLIKEQKHYQLEQYKGFEWTVKSQDIWNI